MKNLFLALIVLMTLTSCKGTLNDCLQAGWEGDGDTEEICCVQYSETEEEKQECRGEDEEGKPPLEL